MSQVNETPNAAPNVQDKRKPAPGVLPKNAQTWVVMGLTAVIMLMLWVSGPAKGAKSSQKTDAPKAETVVGLSPAEIASRLEQERRDQHTPFTPSQRLLGQQTARVDDPGPAFGNQGGSTLAEQDPIKQDLRRREYMSRFASSVSLSYRSPSLPAFRPISHRARFNHLPLHRNCRTRRAIRISIRLTARTTWSLKGRFLKLRWLRD